MLSVCFVVLPSKKMFEMFQCESLVAILSKKNFVRLWVVQQELVVCLCGIFKVFVFPEHRRSRAAMKKKNKTKKYSRLNERHSPPLFGIYIHAVDIDFIFSSWLTSFFCLLFVCFFAIKERVLVVVLDPSLRLAPVNWYLRLSCLFFQGLRNLCLNFFEFEQRRRGRITTFCWSEYETGARQRRPFSTLFSLSLSLSISSGEIMRGLGIIILALLVEKLMCVCIFFAGPSDVLKSPFSFVLFFLLLRDIIQILLFLVMYYKKIV